MSQTPLRPTGETMRGKNLNLDVSAVLHRARRVEDTGAYSLEPGFNGGNDPDAPWPYNRPLNARPFPDGSADCVGVGMWIQGMDRYQPQIAYYGGWVNTNSVFAMPELFVNLGQDFDKVLPGDILAYPSYKDFLGRKRYGHWMTVVKATMLALEGEDALARELWMDGVYIPKKATKLSELEVVHCSQRKPPATRRTPGFAKGKSTAWAFFRPRHRA